MADKLDETEVRVLPNGDVVDVAPYARTVAITFNAEEYAGAEYTWSRGSGGDGSWRIGFGPSNFLLAEGSGWSLKFGRALYRALTADG